MVGDMARTQASDFVLGVCYAGVVRIAVYQKRNCINGKDFTLCLPSFVRPAYLISDCQFDHCMKPFCGLNGKKAAPLPNKQMCSPDG